MANIEIMILGMLLNQPSHGYLIKKNVSTYFGNPYFKLNNSALYRKLTELEEKGCVVGEDVTDGKINKKVYHITDEGKQYLINLLSAPVEPDIDNFSFKVQVSFMDLISQESRVKVLKPLYDAKLQLYNESIRKKEELAKIMPPVSLTVLEYGIKELEISLEFLDKLMKIKGLFDDKF